MNKDPESQLRIRSAALADAESLARIYNFYVRETTITFEELQVSSKDMAARVQGVQSSSLPWIVAEVAGEIIGYAFAKKWKERSAYRFSTEVSVFLEEGQSGRGIGSELYRRLLAQLKSAGVRTALGGIALPNEASIALHEKFGFVKVAQLHQVGFKFQNWIDVGYWQKIL
jgi:phosphinothricin acetyltransferase